MKKRILVIDQHELVHAGISQALEFDESYMVLPPATSLSVAIRQSAIQVPDIVILDPFQPELLDVLPTLREKYPDTGLLVLTNNDSPDNIHMALRQSVDGYVLKGAPLKDLARAIEAILRGEMFIHPSISHVLVDRQGSGKHEFSLTRRQEQVLEMIAEGRTVKQIAKALGVSTKTIESHRVTLMNRLGIHHVPGLVHFAIRYGYVQLSAPLVGNYSGSYDRVMQS